MSLVLVIGGYGEFGARLCRRLSVDGWRVLVAGRNMAAARAMAESLPHAEPVKMDRNGDVAAVLRQYRPLLVIDAAGPFQDGMSQVVEACIAEKIHYCDLADGREFVSEIARFETRAKEAGVVVISGASSVPALSSAAALAMSRDMRRIAQISGAISASNRATAGPSVSAAILSYVGQVVRIWRGKRLEDHVGWHDLLWQDYRVAGQRPIRRLVALCDVPDLQLLPQIMPGHPATIFRAGPEFAFQTRALWLLSWLVRWGWMRSLVPLKRILLALQSLTGMLGSARSAMVVEIKGWEGPSEMPQAVIRRWTLIADKGDGPEIPTLSAQLLARVIRDGAMAPGARSAAGQLPFDAFEPLFANLAIHYGFIREDYTPLYSRVMGAQFDRLPPPVRAMHQIIGDGGAHGSGRVTRGTSLLARLIGWVQGFPKAGAHDIHVRFAEVDGRERWTRDFSGERFSSELSATASGDALVERFGPMRFVFDLTAEGEVLHMHLRRWSVLHIPMPKWLAPRITAREYAAGEDFCFDVSIRYPLIGEIIRYEGALRVV